MGIPLNERPKGISPLGGTRAVPNFLSVVVEFAFSIGGTVVDECELFNPSSEFDKVQ